MSQQESMNSSNKNLNDDEIEMIVIKRDGRKETVSFDKILMRLRNLGNHELHVNYSNLAMKVIEQLYDGIHTAKIDELTSEQCASMTTQHYDYGVLASRILISNHQKNTESDYMSVVEKLYNNVDIHGKSSPLVNDEFYNIVKENHEEIQKMLVYERDFKLDYFGFKTLERAYLFRINNKVVERPQHMWMRVALAIHGNDLEKVKISYDLLSEFYFTHATPTLFNAGTKRQQLSSCYLIAMEDDSIDGIYNTLKECANISKYAGGIGLHIHNIRARNSIIRGTNGTSDGIVSMLKVFNHTARYVNQSGKRNGSFAIYLEPWHADIEDFLQLKKNHGDEEMRARDLFYGLWIPDLFMKRVKENGDWTLMCPDECPGLSDYYGEHFERLYEKYERLNKGRKTIKARELWFQILDSQIETGTPYLLYKDACNEKSNQKNIGTIKSSNLCTEIIEYSDENETAVCNLLSIGLSRFVENGVFNFDKLYEVVKVGTENLNKIIDINFYPTPKTERSNKRHRPIGIGVQGLADVFALMKIPFNSEKAKQLNKEIFETMYYGAMEMSMELSMIHGSYATFKGSPLSKGQFQFNLWGMNDEDLPTKRYNWNELRQKVQKYGVRNSLLIAPMPTASTSQILGNNECIEPFTSNIYSRRTLAGEFVIVNKYLMKELIDLGLWNEDLKNRIIRDKGSVQYIEEIPDDIKERYKIVWELPMRDLIDMSTDRGHFVCQSQSLNLWVENPDYSILTSMHFYAWNKGLKTGIYYLRTKAKASAQQFTIEPEKKPNTGNMSPRDRPEEKDNDKQASSEENNEADEGCLMCSG